MTIFPQIAALTDDLYTAYWTQGADVADPALLGNLAQKHGMAADAWSEVR
jgi:predicted DsbA family dithiol-disulfide isomerase